ncbi:hypothetical protein KP509_1Z118800 [Ceratopteris richardii]|nr:hypothetical protein KP509_1Z118800 [Ceratopteris richardii]
MHRISAILHKRPKEGKHCDQEDDTGSIFSEDPSDGSSRSSMHSPPRLVRSPGIRGLRKIDDIDSSRFSLSNAADHVTEPPAISSPDGSTSPNFSYTYTTANFQTGSPLPSPPRSPVLSAGQTPSLWPLPSPRQLPKKHENSDRSLNGFLEHSDSGEGFVHQSELLKYSLSGVTKENPQKFSSNSVSPKVGAVNHGNSGQNSHSAYLKLGGATNSPRYMKDTRLRTSEHAFLGGTTEDDSLGTEFRHAARYSHKDVPMSRDVGLSSHHSQESALSYPPSPPLSPSRFRSISPGGWIKGHLLGSGAFGKVYKGIHSETGEFCAIKEVEFVQDDHRSQESVEQLKREIALLSTLQHPNIVQYKGSELNLFLEVLFISYIRNSRSLKSLLFVDTLAKFFLGFITCTAGNLFTGTLNVQIFLLIRMEM